MVEMLLSQKKGPATFTNGCQGCDLLCQTSFINKVKQNGNQKM